MAGELAVPRGPGGTDALAAYVGLAPGWYRDSADPSLGRYWDGRQLSEERRLVATRPVTQAPVTHASTTGPSIVSASPRRRSPHESRIEKAAIACAAASMVLVAAVLTVILGNGTSGADAVVVQAARTTLADKTAHVLVTATGGSGGESSTLTGTGSVDFATNAMQVEMPIETDGQQVDFQEVYIDDVLYESFPGIDQVEPGKQWISYDLSLGLKSAGDSSNEVLGNPSAMLHLLQAGGNEVSSLGSTVIGGVSCHGYLVTINTGTVRSELARAQLPAWMRQALANVNIVGETARIYIDGQGLLRRQTFATQMTIDKSAVELTGSVDFSDYGVPVSVSAPPGNEVVSVEKFLQDVQAATNPV
jgi:hypothetical protein